MTTTQQEKLEISDSGNKLSLTGPDVCPPVSFFTMISYDQVNIQQKMKEEFTREELEEYENGREEREKKQREEREERNKRHEQHKEQRKEMRKEVTIKRKQAMEKLDHEKLVAFALDMIATLEHLGYYDRDNEHDYFEIDYPRSYWNE